MDQQDVDTSKRLAKLIRFYYFPMQVFGVGTISLDNNSKLPGNQRYMSHNKLCSLQFEDTVILLK